MESSSIKSSFALSPPIVIRVGKGHWRSPQTVVLELEGERPRGCILPFRRFRLLMNDTVIYEGGGYGIEKFGDYVVFSDASQEVRLDEQLINEPY